MNKRKSKPIKPMETPVSEMISVDVQKALFHMTIKPKNNKGVRK